MLVADLDIDAAEAKARSLRESGGQAAALGLDVGRPESIAQAFARIERDHRRLDVLVNCAGIAKV